MTELTKGANAPLPTPTVEVAVAGAAAGSVDLMVFQLTDARRVRSDADFVFFNQPNSPEGAVRLTGADRISAQLDAVPAEIAVLAIAVSLDDSVAGSLAAIPSLAVTISGGEQYTAPAGGFTTERAAVLVEFYRRGDAWKVRNVSAGWAAGLSGLATEHGVSVDDSPAPAAAPAAPAPSAAAAPPAPAPPAPTPAPAPPVQPQPTPPAQPAPPAPAPGGFPSAPTGQPAAFPPPGGGAAPSPFPPPAQQAGSAPAGFPPPAQPTTPASPFPPPAQQAPQPAAPAFPPPAGAPVAAPPPPQQSAPAPPAVAPSSAPQGGSPKVDLGKRTGAVNLTKGQRVQIDPSELIVASISWPAATDYDVYALVRYADGRTEAVSAFGTKQNPQFSLTSSDGAVRHAGDVGRAGGAAGGKKKGMFGGLKAAAANAGGGMQQTAVERIEIRPHAGIRAIVPVAYSAQSNGTGSFRRYQVTMSIDNGKGTTVRIDAPNADDNDRIYTCVPGIIHITDTGITIDYLEQYSAPNSELRPIIGPDLQIVMDAGELNLYK